MFDDKMVTMEMFDRTYLDRPSLTMSHATSCRRCGREVWTNSSLLTPGLLSGRIRLKSPTRWAVHPSTILLCLSSPIYNTFMSRNTVLLEPLWAVYSSTIPFWLVHRMYLTHRIPFDQTWLKCLCTVCQILAMIDLVCMVMWNKWNSPNVQENVLFTIKIQPVVIGTCYSKGTIHLDVLPNPTWPFRNITDNNLSLMQRTNTHSGTNLCTIIIMSV